MNCDLMEQSVLYQLEWEVLYAKTVAWWLIELCDEGVPLIRAPEATEKEKYPRNFGDNRKYEIQMLQKKELLPKIRFHTKVEELL